MILVKSILKSPKVIIYMLLNKSESLKSGDLYYKTHHNRIALALQRLNCLSIHLEAIEFDR